MKHIVKILAIIGILLLAGLSIGFLTDGCCDSEQAAPTLESTSPDASTQVTPPDYEPGFGDAP